MGSPEQDTLSYVIEPMRLRDVGAVLEVEKRSFSAPWSRAAFMSELLTNDRAYYFVARTTERRGPLVHDEGHITNVAVHPDFRGRGIGRRLMEFVIDFCRKGGASRMTLEVRVSNMIAQRLYRDLGFVSAGIRPGYYRDNNEDALIMWKELEPPDE